MRSNSGKSNKEIRANVSLATQFVKIMEETTE